MVYPTIGVTGLLPSVLAAGGAHVTVVLPPPEPDAAETVMLKAAREAVVVPSDTLMMMLLEVPAAEGVPLNTPVAVLKDAQVGGFWTLKVSVAPVPPVAVGVNE